MKRLLLWIVILTVLFSSGIAFAGRVGGKLPLPALAQWFTNPDGTACKTPCLFGIEPGVTKFSDVEKILNRHPFLPDLYAYDGNDLPETDIKSFHAYSVAVGVSGDITIRPDSSGIVQYLYIAYPMYGETEIPFKDMLLTFGLPQSVSLSAWNNYGYNGFTYQNETIFVQVRDTKHFCKFKIDAPVYYMYIYPKGYYEKFLQEPMAESPPRYHPWAGIARQTYVNRYYSQSRTDLVATCTP